MAGGLPALDAVHSFQLRAGPYQAHTVGAGLVPARRRVPGARAATRAAPTAQGRAAHPSATSNTIMSRKPAMTPRVPVLECSPKWASGMSSSTTTYIMAPAAKDSSQGMRGWIVPATSTTRMPKTGYNTPEALP